MPLASIKQNLLQICLKILVMVLFLPGGINISFPPAWCMLVDIYFKKKNFLAAFPPFLYLTYSIRCLGASIANLAAVFFALFFLSKQIK